MDAIDPTETKPILARLLAPFSKVQPNEVGTVILMTFAAFLLLDGYYLLKTVREPLVLLEGGPEVKLYLRAGQAVLMVGFVHFYGELAKRFGRDRLLAFVFLFFISNLVVFTVLARAEVEIGIPFFFWVGLFSYTCVAQFWALAADIYTEEQGKRLFPIIGGGSSIGAVVGGLFAKQLVPYGPEALMGAAVIVLLACIATIFWIMRRAGTTAKSPHDTTHHDEPISEKGTWAVLSHDKYLWLIAGLVIFLNWVNSSGEYLLDRLVVSAAHDAADPKAYIGAFKADYFAWYNGIGLVLQLFVVSRVLRLVGVRKALLVMPFFALAAYGAAVFFPVVAIMRLVKIGENSLQYSLQDTTRNALFLVARRDEKFVGKTFTDTIAVRLGAIMSSLMVFIGSALGWPTRTFVIINVVLAAIWIIFALWIGREHKKRSAERDRATSSEEPRTARSSE
jgi:ATP:ADP antiporter, AAA family